MESTFAYSLLAIGVALACGLIALKAFSYYNEDSATRLCMTVIAFDMETSTSTYACVLVAVANIICPIAAAVIGAMLGLYKAVALKGDQCLRLQGSRPY